MKQAATKKGQVYDRSKYSIIRFHKMDIIKILDSSIKYI